MVIGVDASAGLHALVWTVRLILSICGRVRGKCTSRPRCTLSCVNPGTGSQSGRSRKSAKSMYERRIEGQNGTENMYQAHPKHVCLVYPHLDFGADVLAACSPASAWVPLVISAGWLVIFPGAPLLCMLALVLLYTTL